MARAAVKAKQAQKAKAQPAPKARARGRRKHASGGNPNQQLFFVRMRKRAKPAYFILAFLFAITFAFLGVGSGSGGLSQLFDNLNIFRSSSTSVSRALKEVQKHPTAPAGFRDLATAYEAKGDTANAIGALQQYTGIRTKDTKAWTELAGLEMTNAQNLITQYENAYAAEQLAAPDQAILPSSTSPVGKALGSNPIEQASATQLNTAVSDLAQRVQLAYSDAVSSYRKVTSIEPKSANAWFQLAQAAQTSGDTATAVSGYKHYLKLNPNGSTAAQIRSLIKSLTKK
jgi:tetratricopeptide (TPR) repeat protein